MSEYANAPQPRELQPVRDTELPLGTHVMKVQELLSYFPSPHSNEDVSEDFVEAPHTHRSAPLHHAQIPTHLSVDLLDNPPTQDDVRGQLEQYMCDVSELMRHAEGAMHDLKLRLIADGGDDGENADTHRGASQKTESPDDEPDALTGHHDNVYDLDKLKIDSTVLEEFITIGTPQLQWKDAKLARADDMVKVRVKAEETGEEHIVETPLDNLILTVMAKYPQKFFGWCEASILAADNFSEGSPLRASLSKAFLESTQTKDVGVISLVEKNPKLLNPKVHSTFVDIIYANWKEDSAGLSYSNCITILALAQGGGPHTDSMKMHVVEMARSTNNNHLLSSAVLLDAIPKDDSLWQRIAKNAQDATQPASAFEGHLLLSLIQTGHRSTTQIISELFENGKDLYVDAFLKDPDLQSLLPTNFYLTDDQLTRLIRLDENGLGNAASIGSFLSEHQRELVQKLADEVITRFTADPIANAFDPSSLVDIRNLLTDEQRERVAALLAEYSQADNEHRASSLAAGIMLSPADSQTQTQLADNSFACDGPSIIAMCIQNGWIGPNHRGRLLQACTNAIGSMSHVTSPLNNRRGDLHDEAILSGLLGTTDIDTIHLPVEHIEYLKLKTGVGAHELAQKIRQGEELSKEEQMRLLVSVFRKPKKGEVGTAGFAIPFHPHPVAHAT